MAADSAGLKAAWKAEQRVVCLADQLAARKAGKLAFPMAALSVPLTAVHWVVQTAARWEKNSAANWVAY